MYVKTRSQLTQHDFEFIAQVLAKTSGEETAILRLLHDSASVTDLLHHRQLFERSMTTPPLFLNILPQLFFYVFVYQALDGRNMADDDLVDYVASVCVDFKSNQNLMQLATTNEGQTVYLVDLLNLLGDAERHQQYLLRRYIGNVSLFLTGFFPDFIFQRSKKKGAPTLAYYEQVGRSQYGTAADESQSLDEDTAPVLTVLSERFIEIRSAINLYNDAYLHLNNPKYSLEIIERQAATLDEASFRQSLDL